MDTLGPGQWKVCWLPGGTSVQVLSRDKPDPDWGPDMRVLAPAEASILMENDQVKAAVKALVGEGFSFQQASDAMMVTTAWSEDPEFVAARSAREHVMTLYNKVMSHLQAGGRLRDLEPQAVELVFQAVGAQSFWYWLQTELQAFGPWPKPYGDLINDLWYRGGAVSEMKRLQPVH